MDNQSSRMKLYKPQMVANKYYQLDTTTQPDTSAIVPALNGRQGDNLREVAIAFVDDGEPHDLTNTSIQLRVLDSSGVVKVSDKVINLVDPTGGLVIFGVPAQIYEAPGDVQRAYFVLQDKNLNGEDQTISTVNVFFSVIENGIDISKKQSSIYISALDKVLSAGGSYAVTNKDNKFTGSDTMHDLTVDTLHNDSLTSLTSQVNQQGEAIQSNVSMIATAKSTISSIGDEAHSAMAGVSSTVNQSVSSAVVPFDKRLSSMESAQQEALSKVSATIKQVEPASTQSSLDSLSTDVDNLWDESNSNSSAIDSMTSAVTNASRVAQSMAPVPDSVNTLDQRVNSLSQSIPWNLSATITSMERAISSLENRSN